MQSFIWIYIYTQALRFPRRPATSAARFCQEEAVEVFASLHACVRSIYLQWLLRLPSTSPASFQRQALL